MLADLERHVEKIRAGIVSRQEEKSMEWAAVPLSDHVKAHAAYMTGLGRAPRTVQDQERLTLAVADGCGWTRLADLTPPVGTLVDRESVRGHGGADAQCVRGGTATAGRRA